MAHGLVINLGAASLTGGYTGLLFPAEWVKAALVLALVSAWTVIALFVFLNQHTRKPHFQLWTAAWMFYSVYLAAAIGLLEAPGTPFLIMVRRACIGLSALYMFYGTLQLKDRARRRRELTLGTLVLIGWSAVPAMLGREALWVSVPVFTLLAAAGSYTGLAYWRKRRAYPGAKVLTAGFFCWGLNLFLIPFSETSFEAVTISYIASAVVSGLIAMGMIVEEQSAVAEGNYRALFNAAQDAVFLVDFWSLRVLDANPAAARFTGCTLPDIVGRTIAEFCPRLAQTDTAAPDLRRAHEAVFRPLAEMPLRRANGDEIPCDGEVRVVEWRQRLALQFNLRQRVPAAAPAPVSLAPGEETVALQQRIGLMANQLNNPLAVAMGYAQVMALRSGFDEKTRRDLLRIRDETDNAARIVRDLLDFVAPKVAPRPLPVAVPAAAPGRAGPPRRSRLLVVDDEPGMVALLTELFEGAGYQVDSASNGATALAKAGAADYGAILSDLHMPDMDGQQFYEQLGATHPERARRMVFLTGDIVTAEARAFLATAPNGWLAKPFKVEEVLRVVEDVLGRN